MIDRAVVAQRAASRAAGRRRRIRTVAALSTGYEGVRRHGNKRAPSDRGQGLWRTTSQNYRTGVTIDSRWAVSRNELP